MATSIAWTEETWNPTVGCSRVSPGCDGCYAIGVAHRAMQPAHVGLTKRVITPAATQRASGIDRIDWTGEVRLLPDRLDTPLRWRKPRRVFVDSMSDLFHPEVPDSFVARVWSTMARCPQHTFQVLTKRPQRVAALLSSDWFETEMANDAAGRETYLYRKPLPNVWLGTSIEDQRYADLRIPHLLATPAAVRFLSIEPLLGPVDLSPYVFAQMGERLGGFLEPMRSAIDWVIVGGESGPGHREMDPGWLADVVGRCVAAGVPVFVKQDSGSRSGQQGRIPDDVWARKEFPS